MVAFVSLIFDCNGPMCGQYTPPSGPGEVALGIIFSALALAPGVVLHRFLRRRGR